jgi:hypothetical protein
MIVFPLYLCLLIKIESIVAYMQIYIGGHTVDFVPPRCSYTCKISINCYSSTGVNYPTVQDN